MTLDQIIRQKNGRVISRFPDTPITEIIGTMRAENIGAVVIVHADGGVAGIISEREIISALNRHGAAAMKLFAQDIMVRDLPLVRSDEKLQNVVALMTRMRLRHMPVVDGPHLVGILSIGDVLASRLEERNEENAVLRDMARWRLAIAA
ncbi:MAG: CBS domain-containing protein [Sphingobium sp.]|nr:CBS domain-containing protein [Sphingobium sp.]